MEARQSAMALPATVIAPVSPEGTKVITSGLPDEPRSPALTVGGLAINGQLGVGKVAVGAGAVAAVVGAAVVGAAVGWAQALKTSELKTITESKTNRKFFFTILLLSKIKRN